jgi:hypothetical protein
MLTCVPKILVAFIARHATSRCLTRISIVSRTRTLGITLGLIIADYIA